MYVKECMGVLKDPPSRVCTIEVDRSLLLFNTPGFDPHTGEVFGDGSGTCPDGSPAVIRWRALVTFEAKISQHGLPIMIVRSSRSLCLAWCTTNHYLGLAVRHVPADS